MIEISPEISGEALRFLLFMLAGILLILAFDLFSDSAQADTS